MREERTPYLLHVFVCTNDRHGTRKSCADGNSMALRERLREGVEKRGWLGRVRISQCGCMGLCERGPNVMIYPAGVWFQEAKPDDADAILGKLDELLRAASQG